MKQDLFMRIHDDVVAHDAYFVQKRNVVGRLGLSSLQKVTTAFRRIAYGVLADYVDEYVQIGESTTIENLKKFATTTVKVCGDEYLRAPNSDALKRLLTIGERRGFPGMLESIDCMHWKWKNCPIAWHGMFIGHIHEPTIILEVVASYDLWIWHAFFGLHGSLNDINVLERSYVFSGLYEGSAPPISYKVNGRSYDMGYYLADGIYPSWATLVKTIPAPQGNKHRHIAKEKEGARKDVKRAFGTLQARFAIVRNPARLWDKDNLKHIMMACIIMNNMIIEDERDEHKLIRRIRKIYDIDKEDDHVDEIPHISFLVERTPTIMEFIANRHRFHGFSDPPYLLLQEIWGYVVVLLMCSTLVIVTTTSYSEATNSYAIEYKRLGKVNLCRPHPSLHPSLIQKVKPRLLVHVACSMIFSHRVCCPEYGFMHLQDTGSHGLHHVHKCDIRPTT